MGRAGRAGAPHVDRGPLQLIADCFDGSLRDLLAAVESKSSPPGESAQEMILHV
jgi:hypothetical protein